MSLISPISTVVRPHRAQVAALPVRLGPSGPEIMLITTRGSHRWIVPKGWPMKGREDCDAAAQEALEEAGLQGRIRKHPIGAYTYRKRVGDIVEPFRVMVYRLDVEAEKRVFRELGQRERRWFSAEEAAILVSEPRLGAMILDIADDDAATRVGAVTTLSPA